MTPTTNKILTIAARGWIKAGIPAHDGNNYDQEKIK